LSGSDRIPALGRRFADDGRAALALTATQLEARGRIAEKLRAGIYRTAAVPCPACGAEEGPLLTKKDMYGLPMSVVCCERCGLCYTTPRMTPETLQSFYNEHYRALDRADAARVQDFFELEREKGEIIWEYLADGDEQLPAGSLVLEIGCGAGGVLDFFRARGMKVLGVDLGATYVDFGAREHELDLHTGDLSTALEILDRRGLSPRLVVYEQVLEHLPDPAEELAQLRRRLGPDARVFVGVPGLRNIRRHYDSDVLRYFQLPHLVHFELASLAAVAARAGYDVVRGDDTVRALLAPGSPAEPPGSPGDTVDFLRALERRRRRQVVARLPGRVVRRLARSVRGGSA
jgi:SAM-dependent methyltransferase